MVGGVVVVALAAAGIFLFLRRRRRNHPVEPEKVDMVSEPHRPALSPYAYSSEDVRPTSYDTGRPEDGPMSQANASGLELLGSSASLVPIPENSPLNSQSAKMREISLNARLAYAESVSGSSNTGSNAGTASSQDPLSPGEARSARSAGSGSLSPTEVLGLRAEVENLRRVMQEIRADRLEPPPEYTG